jgi:hypothetical protein
VSTRKKQRERERNDEENKNAVCVDERDWQNRNKQVESKMSDNYFCYLKKKISKCVL